MANVNVTMWLVLIAAAIGCGYWQRRENAALSRQWRRDLDDRSARWLERFANVRSMQLMAVLSVAAIVVAIYDWQLNDARSQLIRSETERQFAAQPQGAQQKDSPAHAGMVQPQPAGRPAADMQYSGGMADARLTAAQRLRSTGRDAVAGVQAANPQLAPSGQVQVGQAYTQIPGAVPVAQPPAAVEPVSNPYAPVGMPNTVPVVKNAPAAASSEAANPAQMPATSLAPALGPAVQVAPLADALAVTGATPVAVPPSPQAVPPPPQTPGATVAAPQSNLVAPPPGAPGNAALPKVEIAPPVVGALTPNLPQIAGMAAQPVTPAPVEQPQTIQAAPLEPQAQPVNLTATEGGQTLEDVYNPEKRGSDTTARLDEMKKRYEDVLVLYFFLQKCGRTTPAEYHTITAALAQEMASVNAPGRLQYDILTAAQGSYREMYSKSQCEGPSVNGLYTQYQDYVRTVSQTITGQ